MIISILIAPGVLASSHPWRRNKILSKNIISLLQTRHTAAQADNQSSDRCRGNSEDNPIVGELEERDEGREGFV